MKVTQKPASDVQECPNCNKDVTIPKSTRSFICKECHAVLKVVETESGASLKVVGRSVEENEEYQVVEAQVIEIKAKLKQLHETYQSAVNKPLGSATLIGAWLGVLTIPVGLISSIFSGKTGLFVAGAGVVVFLLMVLVRKSQKSSREASARKIADAINEMGSQRDRLQRKAASIKTRLS